MSSQLQLSDDTGKYLLKPWCNGYTKPDPDAPTSSQFDADNLKFNSGQLGDDWADGVA